MTRGKRTYTTVVADSHNLFRRGLATLISAEADMEVLGEAGTVGQVMALLNPVEHGGSIPHADIVVMEVAMARDNPEVVKAIRQSAASVALLLMAAEETAECLDVTVASGACGYMLKSMAPSKLVAGIRQAALRDEREGISAHAPDLKALTDNEQGYSRTSPLTAREQEVMTLLAEGRTVREVALELALSIKTIEAHKLNLMRKLDIHNRASLVDYAVKAGFIAVQPAA